MSPLILNIISPTSSLLACRRHPHHAPCSNLSSKHERRQTKVSGALPNCNTFISSRFYACSRCDHYNISEDVFLCKSPERFHAVDAPLQSCIKTLSRLRPFPNNDPFELMPLVLSFVQRFSVALGVPKHLSSSLMTGSDQSFARRRACVLEQVKSCELKVRYFLNSSKTSQLTSTND